MLCFGKRNLVKEAALMRLTRAFFERDVLEVAPELVGKMLVSRQFNNSPGLTGVKPPSLTLREGNSEERAMITEVEAYRGEEDLASHARFGRTKRNAVMYEQGGLMYVYLVYGLHWMLNIVTGKVGEPQAVLIRGVKGESLNGPGKVGKWLNLDKSFYGEDVTQSERIWVEDADNFQFSFFNFQIQQTSRVGVEYAGEWAKKKWRWVMVGAQE
jgi:DNA-3-methyladenine glycosylase